MKTHCRTYYIDFRNFVSEYISYIPELLSYYENSKTQFQEFQKTWKFHKQLIFKSLLEKGKFVILKIVRVQGEKTYNFFIRHRQAQAHINGVLPCKAIA